MKIVLPIMLCAFTTLAYANNQLKSGYDYCHKHEQQTLNKSSENYCLPLFNSGTEMLNFILSGPGNFFLPRFIVSGDLAPNQPFSMSRAEGTPDRGNIMGHAKLTNKVTGGLIYNGPIKSDLGLKCDETTCVPWK